MRKYLTWKYFFRGISVLSDFVTLWLALKDWAMTNIWCNPYIRLVLCSIIFTVLVFAAEPLLLNIGILNKKARAALQGIIFALCVIIIFLLPKGDCRGGAASVLNQDSAISSRKDSSIVAPKIVVIHDTPEAFKNLPKLPAQKRRESLSSSKPPVAAKTSPSQTIDSGSTGLQSNAPNFGQQAGRDINNFGSVPRQFTIQVQNQLLSNLPNKNEKIVITCLMGDGESFSFATAIKDFLTIQGYSKVDGVNQAVFSKPVIGQFMNRDSSGVKITIGSKP